MGSSIDKHYQKVTTLLQHIAETQINKEKLAAKENAEYAEVVEMLESLIEEDEAIQMQIKGLMGGYSSDDSVLTRINELHAERKCIQEHIEDLKAVNKQAPVIKDRLAASHVAPSRSIPSSKDKIATDFSKASAQSSDGDDSDTIIVTPRNRSNISGRQIRKRPAASIDEGSSQHNGSPIEHHAPAANTVDNTTGDTPRSRTARLKRQKGFYSEPQPIDKKPFDSDDDYEP